MGTPIVKGQKMKIADILSAKDATTHWVGHDQDFSMALKKMHDANIGSIVVIHSETGALLGLISQPEILAGLASFGNKALGHCSTGIMRKPSPVCNPGDDVKAVMRRMTQERNRHVVVTLGDEILGVISIGDLVAAQLQEAHLEAGVLRDMARSHLLSASA